MLDDGHITDSQGRKVSFKDNIIIMTSNTGAQKIVAPKLLGFAAKESEEENYKNMKGNVMEDVKDMFRPEFLNRIDEIIVFHSLSKEHVREIVEIMINNISKRTTESMNLQITASDEVLDYLLEKGYDKVYGARPLRRTIQNEIEDLIADEFLSGKIKRGDKVELLMSEEKTLTFKRSRSRKLVKK